ncbi:MAG: HAMP domain-containing protein [Gammaproteobacteria bacterium]|nr:HAMP domain-containing protein [Gammaproteobacteria bacterium]
MSNIQHRLSRLTGFSRLSVGHKLAALTLLFVAVISAMILYISLTLDQQKSDGTVINIAGRQRMLTQKFTKEFYLAFQQAKMNGAAMDRGSMTKTGRLFDVSLKALRDGGETFLDLGMSKPVQLPGTRTAGIREQLGQVEQHWQNLQKSVAEDIAEQNAQEKLLAINKFSVKTLAAMNKAVGMFAGEADGKVQTMLANQKWIWGAAVFFSVLIAWLIAHAITVPLDQIVTSTRRIASGNLKKHPLGELSQDELGVLTRQVDEMRTSLTDVISSVQQNSQQMSHSSEHISNISNEIYDSSQRQEEEGQKVLVATDSLQQIATTVSEHIDLANQTAEEAGSYARDGVVVVHESIRELGSAVESVNATASKMEALHQATGQINEIIVSIHNIADQTNLLALNAAIEAARAGEQGRGFAVVAEEVRNLAGRTAKSTTQITELIQRLTNQVEESVSSMQQVVEKVHNSQEKSEQTVSVFEAMTDGINRTTSNTEQIAQYNQQQMGQLGELHERLNQLVTVLAVSAEKASSTSLVANDLHTISEHLNELLRRFETDGVESESRDSEEKRIYPRINNQLKVTLIQGDVTAQGVTQDISMTGLYIKSMEHFEASRSVDIEIHLPQEITTDSGSILTLSARIVRHDIESDVNQYGVDFKSLSMDKKEQLKGIFRYFGKSCTFA